MLKKKLFLMTCVLIFSTTSYADIVVEEAAVMCCYHDEDVTIISEESKGEKALNSSEDTSTVKASIYQKCKSVVDCKAFIFDSTDHSYNVTSVNILQTDE